MSSINKKDGEPVGMTNDSGTSYFGTDILGSVRSVTDKYGAVQSSYDYDAFGSPYLGNLDNGMSFGYTGKAYDAGTGLYDYGFRDYSPNNARFTTVDPIRDGSNWFSYVVNDPVNYVDPLGLKTFEEIKEKAKAIVNDFVYGKQETIEVDGKEITVQHSSQLLEKISNLKDSVSDGLIYIGNKTGFQQLVNAGEAIAQIPTGRVDNQTGDYLAFAGEHSPLGKAYLGEGVTYIFKDFITTHGDDGNTIKMVSIGDVTVGKSSEITISPATASLNNVANTVKTFLNEPGLGQWINDRIDNITHHRITTELYGIYSNRDLLSLDGVSSATGLSNNLKDFKTGRNPSNAQYANPEYFKSNNITSDSSSNIYIGFNGFSGGCTK